LSPENTHFTANFNSLLGNWYFGTDGKTPPDQYDLMSVVLHTLGHGLGFIGSMTVSADGEGSWGWRNSCSMIYDRFIVNGHDQELLDTFLFPNPSGALAGQLQSDQLFFDGPRARAANGDKPVRIYAPIGWDPGSSCAHLNEETFPRGDPNSLMTPQIGMGEAIHNPGPVALAVLEDLGW